ncbi:unnamed protein product [Penicillium glandicola]
MDSNESSGQTSTATESTSTAAVASSSTSSTTSTHTWPTLNEAETFQQNINHVGGWIKQSDLTHPEQLALPTS